MHIIGSAKRKPACGGTHTRGDCFLRFNTRTKQWYYMKEFTACDICILLAFSEHILPLEDPYRLRMNSDLNYYPYDVYIKMKAAK